MLRISWILFASLKSTKLKHFFFLSWWKFCICIQIAKCFINLTIFYRPTSKHVDNFMNSLFTLLRRLSPENHRITLTQNNEWTVKINWIHVSSNFIGLSLVKFVFPSCTKVIHVLLHQNTPAELLCNHATKTLSYFLQYCNLWYEVYYNQTIIQCLNDYLK